MPSPFTVAIAGLELENTTDLPPTVCPSLSLSATVSVLELPTAMVFVGGRRSTELTAGCTTICVCEVTPSTRAVMMVFPIATPVTTPLASTAAVVGLRLDQVIFLQQAGRNKHEHICESLELFAAEVMP